MAVVVSGGGPNVTIKRDTPVNHDTNYSEDQLQSILGVDAKFIDAWRSLFGGDKSLQGYAAGLDQGTTKQTPDEVRKVLATDLSTQYKLHKETYDAQHPGGLTGVLVSIGGTMYNVGGTVVKTAIAVPEFLAMLANTNTWVRVGEGVLGMACLSFGMVLLARELGMSAVNRVVEKVKGAATK